jgi:hypothetical protein
VSRRWAKRSHWFGFGGWVLRVPVRLLQAALTGTTPEETLCGCGCRSLREPFERYWTYGTPERVAEFLRPYVTAGCSAINVIPRATDDETAIASVGELVIVTSLDGAASATALPVRSRRR